MNEKSSKAIISISLSRNIIPLIGLSIHTNERIQLYDFTDTPSLIILIKKINSYEQCTLLIPEKQEILCTTLNIYKNYEIVKLPRQDFEDDKSKFLHGCKFIPRLRNKYFLLTSLNALIKFINLKVDPEKITYKILEGYCFLSSEAINSLDLVTSKDNGKSLFEVIDNTKTQMGKRRLKGNLIQPFFDRAMISNRHDLIKFLNLEKGSSSIISECLESFVDIDSLIIETMLIKNKSFDEQIQILMNVFRIKSLLNALTKLKEMFIKDEFIDHNIINEIKSQFKIEMCDKLNIEIDKIIKFDEKFQDLSNFKSAPERFIKYINHELDPFLDISIKIFYEVKNDIENEFATFNKTLGTDFELVFDWNYGFLIKLKTSDLDRTNFKAIRVSVNNNELLDITKSIIITDDTINELNSNLKLENTSKLFTMPSSKNKTESEKEYCSLKSTNKISNEEEDLSNIENDSYNSSISKTKNHETDHIIILKKHQEVLFVSTIDMIKLNSRLKTSVEQIIQILHVPCTEVLRIFQEQCKYFFKISEVISELDIINSLYLYGIQDQSILPEISDSILISNSSHPLFDKYNRKMNNIYASPKLHYNIITGCNMNGKTIYAKSIALNIILSQIGSPIRADYAKVKPFNKILTRLKHDGNIDERLSTYEYELHEIKNIIDIADKNTLIIIDELGRGSTYIDGTTMALLTCQKLLAKQSFVFFITHFIEIIEYLKHLTNVNILKCSNYSVNSGICENSQGIELCKDYFPHKIIDEAIKIKKKLNQRKNNLVFENGKIQLALMIMESGENEKKILKEKLKNIMTNKN